MDQQVVVLSNRGPFSFRLEEGRPVAARASGGLSSSLAPLLAGAEVTWIASAVSDADRRAAEAGIEVDDFDLQLVTVPETEYRLAYDVVANSTLWFVFHELYDLPRRPSFDRMWPRAWKAFEDLNETFADRAADTAPEGSVVLVQDYHLPLVGSRLRELRPDLRTVHFTHTPFPGPDALSVLPGDVAHRLLSGLSGHTACGFHSHRWRSRFEQCCHEWGVEPPATFDAPLGTDPAALLETASDPVTRQKLAELEQILGDRQLVCRVDRIELSKNIVRGIEAFEDLLQTRPEWQGEVVHGVFVYPSREGVVDYLAYRQEIQWAAERVNRRYGTDDWQPVLLDTENDYPRSIAALIRTDVALVNPVRDGLNLVATEMSLVNERDAVLLLSTRAGVHDRLKGVCWSINPFDLAQTSDAMHGALTMDLAERVERANRLRALARERTPGDWLADQLAAVGVGERAG